MIEKLSISMALFFKKCYSYYVVAFKFSIMFSFLLPLIAHYCAAVEKLSIWLLMVGITTTLDVITGVLKSYPNIKSRKFRETKIFQILLFVICLICFIGIDVMLRDEAEWLSGHWGSKALCLFHIFNEVFSILENTSIMGYKPAIYMIRLIRIRMPTDYSKAMGLDEVVIKITEEIKNEEDRKESKQDS